MVANKETILERFKRRILRGQYKRSEHVILYPLSIFVSMENLYLPLPTCTDNREYLTASSFRRSMSILARIIQILLYSLLAVLSTLVFISKLPQYGHSNIYVLIFSPLVFLFVAFHIVLSISYMGWMIRHFHTQWTDLRV